MKEQTLPPQTSPQSTISIRPAEIEDMLPCSRLDSSYTTDYVWQMQFRENERMAQSTFTRIRLPRTMTVSWPFGPEDTLTVFQQASYLFVAHRGDAIIGYISGMLESWHNTLTLDTLTVHPQYRRQGAAKALLNVAKTFALENNCLQITMTMQTKNHPAITFAQKQGAILCGYHDKYYPNGDIALIFALPL